MPEIRRPESAAKPWFRREDLRDPAFYEGNRSAIHEAIREGRMLEPGADPPKDYDFHKDLQTILRSEK